MEYAWTKYKSNKVTALKTIYTKGIAERFIDGHYRLNASKYLKTLIDHTTDGIRVWISSYIRHCLLRVAINSLRPSDAYMRLSTPPEYFTQYPAFGSYVPE